MGFNSWSLIVVAALVANQCFSIEIRLGVILPEDSSFPWSIKQVLPAIQIAIERVQRDILSPEHRVITYVKDSECSAPMGPLAAIDLHKDEHVHAFFGPVCRYAVASVARYSPYWNVPVITAGASAHDFDDKTEFKLLTRVHETYSSAADNFIELAKMFNWTRFGLIYQRSSTGSSDCHFRMLAIYFKIKETLKMTPWLKTFEWDISSHTDFEGFLQAASQNARIIVLCGDPDSVRELMITAHGIGIDNGEYVFLNMDSGINAMEAPWYREGNMEERNSKAKKAYEALMTISPRKISSSEYHSFSEEVKRRAKMLYQNITYSEGEVNSYVAAFHDAVIIFGLALNETIEAGEPVTDGKAVTRRMWNKTFNGITGTVAIDVNGDRRMDYSLLDMNPATGRFEVVMNYIGHLKELVPIPGRQIHWGADYDNAPPDTPKCGFDNSKCENNGESTDASTSKSSSRTKVTDMLGNLQLTLSKIEEAVQEHNASLLAITKLVKEETRRDVDT